MRLPGPGSILKTAMKWTRRLWWTSLAAVAAVALVFLGHPISLSKSGDLSDWSEHRVCAAWLPTGPPYDRLVVTAVDGSAERFRGYSRQWWIAATPGTALYRDLKNAKRGSFELDNGSGQTDVCVGREVSFKNDRSNVVRALLDECGMAIKVWSLRGAPSDQVALSVRPWTSNDSRCDVSHGEPVVHDY